MNATTQDYFYFIPNSKATLNEETERLYFDKNLRSMSTSRNEKSYYEVAVRVKSLCDFSDKFPLADKSKNVIRWIDESISGSVIQFSGQIQQLQSIKEIEESAKQEVFEKLDRQLCRATTGNFFTTLVFGRKWSIVAPRATQVQFAASTSEKTSDSVEYRKKSKPGERKQKLKGADLLWNLLKEQLNSTMRLRSSRDEKPVEFINYIILSTLNELSENIREGKISQEEAVSNLEKLLKERISIGVKHAELISYEDYMELRENIIGCRIQIENIEFLEQSIKNGLWRPGTNRAMLYKELSTAQIFYVQHYLANVLKSPEIAKAINDYLLERREKF